ncbi:probable WRKY transcription factor 14 [Diospyros lotus]|uniref:probable WRKY transcription factor 14 n=1 Tax=Diospyros lotus TaxID=55363 RepID=UPI002250014D|nr:probable WRKY transcription factor 14 [Diospyros lotus]
MCSYFHHRMDNYQGDLADIVRASGGAIAGAGAGEVPASNWQFLGDSSMNYPVDDFGDPFSSMRDPLLDELEIHSSGFFNCSSSSAEIMRTSAEDTAALGGGAGGGGVLVAQKILEEEMKRPCNIFSRMLQISPNAKLSVSPGDSPVVAASPRAIKASPLAPIEVISAGTSKNCLVENSTAVQISSPRNTGIKRRKSQAKKVVCIPAPAPANSRPSGEVVPSDLWAWRKYGQKPIKGSPYPRGYYRCSSSKGCSARKQVERSRTDPNMLVITYTSEHNHPWPTQRNALAGSTRSQPSKSTSGSKNSQAQRETSLKEEQKEISNNNENLSSSIATGSSSTSGQPVKEEMEELQKQMEMDNEGEFSEGFPQSYRPALPETGHSEDFFADLGEIEADPLNLLFGQGFSGDEEGGSNKNKGLDPFGNLFDWTGNNSNNINDNA